MSGDTRLTAVEREVRRLRAIDAIEAGLKQSQVASLLGTSRTSVSNWVGRFKDQGRDGLLAQRAGRPRAQHLTSKGAEACRWELLTRTPDKLHLSGFLWTWKAVQALMTNKLDSEVSRWTVTRYLSGWGLNVPGPLESYETVAPERVRKWFTQKFPELKEKAHRENRSVLFLERTTAEAQLTGPVARRQNAPTILWVIAGRGEWAFMPCGIRFDADTVIDFLERVVRHRSSPVLLIAADHSVYRTARVVDWLSKRETEISLVHPLSSHLTM